MAGVLLHGCSHAGGQLEVVLAGELLVGAWLHDVAGCGDE